VAAARDPNNVVELGWQLGFGFEVKLVWREMGEMHPSLYTGMGAVRKDEDSN
jgi:hypothetical protein